MHLLYLKSFDLRLQLLFSRLGWRVNVASNLAALRRSYRPGGCIVVDVEDGLEPGLVLVESLAARLERPLVIPICANGSLEFFRRCFMAGAVDVLDKSFDDQRIADALAAFTTTCPQAPAITRTRQRRSRYGLLSGRERDVFRHLVEGLTNRQIAAVLALSPRTVEVHRAHIQEKLGVRNVAQLVGEYGGFVALPA
jgi:FixJ family two-component response regulator